MTAARPTSAQLMRMSFVQRRAALAAFGPPPPVEAAPEPVLPPIEHPDWTHDEMIAASRAYRRWLYDPAKHPAPTPEQMQARRAYAEAIDRRRRARQKATP